MKVAGWTLCFNLDSDRPAYEADLLVCRHCGKTVFMCDSFSKKPLPASAVAESCWFCDEKICGRCKNALRSGKPCKSYLDKIGADEEAYANAIREGSWISAKSVIR